MRRRIKLALAVLIAAAPAAAQQQREPSTYDRAIAAGYKALTLCSGIFNAGRTQAQVEALNAQAEAAEQAQAAQGQQGQEQPSRRSRRSQVAEGEDEGSLPRATL